MSSLTCMSQCLYNICIYTINTTYVYNQRPIQATFTFQENAKYQMSTASEYRALWTSQMNVYSVGMKLAQPSRTLGGQCCWHASSSQMRRLRHFCSLTFLTNNRSHISSSFRRMRIHRSSSSTLFCSLGALKAFHWHDPTLSIYPYTLTHTEL